MCHCELLSHQHASFNYFAFKTLVRYKKTPSETLLPIDPGRQGTQGVLPVSSSLRRLWEIRSFDSLGNGAARTNAPLFADFCASLRTQTEDVHRAPERDQGGAWRPPRVPSAATGWAGPRPGGGCRRRERRRPEAVSPDAARTAREATLISAPCPLRRRMGSAREHFAEGAPRRASGAVSGSRREAFLASAAGPGETRGPGESSPVGRPLGRGSSRRSRGAVGVATRARGGGGAWVAVLGV